MNPESEKDRHDPTDNPAWTADQSAEPGFSPRPSVRGRWDPPANPGVSSPSPGLEAQPASRLRLSCGGVAHFDPRAWLAMALVLSLPTAIVAGPASSPAYSIQADVADAGGHPAASAIYRQEGSLGGFAGIATAAGGVELVKHGYAGQLYEVSSVVVSATTTNVDEGATRQLFATARLDDGTVLRLPGASVAWSVVDGPIRQIDVAGLALAGAVYRDTGATVQALYGGRRGVLGLWVRNADNDNYGIYGGDHLDDAWQVQHFGENNPAGLASADPDGDGQSNGYEETVGSIPTDASSYFRFRIERVPGSGDRMNLIFSPRVAGRSYVVQSRPGAATGAFVDLGAVSVADAGAVRTVTDLNAAGTNKFYRVRITKP